MWRRTGNKYPFIVLLIIHTSLLLYTFIKKNNRKTLLGLLLSNIGMAYLFEYIVLNIFQAYKYKPKLMKNNYLDNILGAILSQAVYIPFTSVFLTAFQLKWKAKLFFIVYFQTIEWLFLKLRVYKVKRWSPLLTCLLLPFYFTLSDKWYDYLRRGNPIVRFISLFLAVWVTGINMLYMFAVKRNVRFGWGKIKTWREHFVLAPLYTIILSLGATCWSLLRSRLFSRLGYLSFAVGLDEVLKRFKLVKETLGNPVLNAIIHSLNFSLVERFKRMIYVDVKEENREYTSDFQKRKGR